MTVTHEPRPGTVGPPVVTPATRRRRTATFAAWLALLGGAALTLHAAGSVLPGPPLLHPSAWPRWAAGRDPVVAAFAVVRLLALVATWYGLVVTVTGVALRLASAEHLASLADRVTVGPLRRVVAATVAVGISTGSMAAAGAAPTTVPASVPEPTSAPAGPAGSPSGGPPVTVTMHLLGPGADAPPSPSPSPSPQPTAPPSIPPAEGTSSPENGAEAPATWTVRPGQCFWSIAGDVLGRAWGRLPTDAEIVPYWRRLIEANRAALSDPHNPDLIFPGQVFSLPEP